MNAWLVSLGLTRDHWLWFTAKVVSAAAMITTGVLDPLAVAAYLGIPLSTTGAHWIFGLAAVVLYLSGQYSSSPLPGRKIAAWLLPLFLLAGAGVVMPACASSNATAVHVAVAADTALAGALHALKVDEASAYASGLYPQAKHIQYLKTVRAADVDAIAVTDAIDAWRAAGGNPGSVPAIVSSTKSGLQQILADLSTVPTTNPFIVSLKAVLALLN